MPHTIKTALTLLLFLAGCPDTGGDRQPTSSTTGELEESSSGSPLLTGEVTEGSTSSTGSSSTGEGSSSSSTGEVPEVEPEPQPDPGDVYGECYAMNADACPAYAQCLGYAYEEWDMGICVQSCSADGIEVCAPPPASGSTLTCTEISSLPHRFCVLDCTGGGSCPVGMECLQLPKQVPEAKTQKVCV